MENSHALSFAIGGILSTLAQIAVIIGCIILVTKQKNGATILMLAASILSLFFAIGNFSWTLVASRYGPDSILSWSKIAALIGPLPYILFAVGLLLFAINHVKKQQATG